MAAGHSDNVSPEIPIEDVSEPSAERGPRGERGPVDVDAGLEGCQSPGVDSALGLVRRPAYEVRIDAFEGPMDLLLHLIREQEIDIHDIPIAAITEQYLEYLSFMQSLDLALAGEFLEMAATLIRIKVRTLLPPAVEEGEEEEDPREQLVRKLVEYREFKEAASRLSETETERRSFFPRGVDPRTYKEYEDEEQDTEELLRDVTLFDLVDSLREVLSRVPERIDIHAVDVERVTVEEEMERISAVASERGSVVFSRLFDSSKTRADVITTFIALLELVRLGTVVARQEKPFGEIVITLKTEE
jgi:segregation and condensation protein A